MSLLCESGAVVALPFLSAQSNLMNTKQWALFLLLCTLVCINAQVSFIYVLYDLAYCCELMMVVITTGD